MTARMKLSAGRWNDTYSGAARQPLEKMTVLSALALTRCVADGAGAERTTEKPVSGVEASSGPGASSGPERQSTSDRRNPGTARRRVMPAMTAV